MIEKKTYSRVRKEKGLSRSLLMKRAKRRKIKKKQTEIFNKPLIVRLLDTMLTKLIRRETRC